MDPLTNRIHIQPTGLVFEPAGGHTVRRASDLVGYASDAEALRQLIESGNPVIYETHEAPVPEEAGHLMYGITVIQPGKIGAEYYMTKGHYHARRETAEIYFGLQGQGYLVMEEEGGQFRAVPVEAGTVVYVPPGWAHRSVNTGSVPLIMFYIFPADAGHDYATIEKKGFSHVIVEREGKPVILPTERIEGRRRQGGNS